MNTLLAGFEREDRVAILIEATKITSEDVIGAVEDYLCKGYCMANCVALNGVTQGQITRAIDAINKVNNMFDKLKSCDDAHRNKTVKC